MDGLWESICPRCELPLADHIPVLDDGKSEYLDPLWECPR